MAAIKKMTKLMIELLMECHERELLAQEPCNLSTAKYCKGLFTRKLVELRPYSDNEGKRTMGIFITPLGKNAITTNMK